MSAVCDFIIIIMADALGLGLALAVDINSFILLYQGIVIFRVAGACSAILRDPALAPNPKQIKILSAAIFHYFEKLGKNNDLTFLEFVTWSNTVAGKGEDTTLFGILSQIAIKVGGRLAKYHRQFSRDNKQLILDYDIELVNHKAQRKTGEVTSRLKREATQKIVDQEAAAILKAEQQDADEAAALKARNEAADNKLKAEQEAADNAARRMVEQEAAEEAAKLKAEEDEASRMKAEQVAAE